MSIQPVSAWVEKPVSQVVPRAINPGVTGTTGIPERIPPQAENTTNNKIEWQNKRDYIVYNGTAHEKQNLEGVLF